MMLMLKKKSKKVKVLTYKTEQINRLRLKGNQA